MMPSMNGRIIPSELSSLILKHLDKPSLATCTLLSNKDGWHALARTQLFRTLTINICLKDYEHNFLAFSRYVTSAPKHSIEYTRKLTLRGERYAECSVHDLLRVLERLPGLWDLELEKFWLRSSDTASGSSRFTLPKQLKSIAMNGVELELDMQYAEGLRFDNVVASTECSLVELLGYVPYIKTLKLQAIVFTWHSDFESRDPMGKIRFAVARMEGQKLPSNLRLKNLSVLVAHEKVGPFLLHMLQNSTVGDELQRLSVAHPNEDQCHTKEFILRVGRDVKHLELSYIGKDAHIYDLAEHRPFTSLRLNIGNSFLSKSQHHMAAWITTALEPPALILDPSTTFSELIFDMSYFRPIDARRIKVVSQWSLDWNDVDVKIRNRKGLEKVTFALRDVRAHVGVGHDAEGLTEEARFIKEHLPLSDAAGCLAFEFHDMLDPTSGPVPQPGTVGNPIQI